MFAEKTAMVKYFIVFLAVLAVIASFVGVLSPGWYIYEGRFVNYYKEDLGRFSRVIRDAKEFESSPDGADTDSHRVGADGESESPGADPANTGGSSGLSEASGTSKPDINPRRPFQATDDDNTGPGPASSQTKFHGPAARPNNRDPKPTHASNNQQRTRNPIVSNNKTSSPVPLANRPIRPNRPRPTNISPPRISPTWNGRTRKPGKTPSWKGRTSKPGKTPAKPLPGRPKGPGRVLPFTKPTAMPNPSHSKQHKLPNRRTLPDNSTRPQKQRPVLSDKMPQLATFFDWFKGDENELDWTSIGSAEFSIHIGLWWGKVCTKMNEQLHCDSEKLSHLFDSLNTPEVNVSSWNDMRIESIFALLFCLLGLTGTVFTIQPFCLQTKKRISLVLAVTGMVVSCVLLLVVISRIANIHAHVNEALERNPNATHLNTPWSPVLCCTGAGLAFATVLTLVLVTWRESREKWYKFDGDVDLTKTDGTQEIYTDISDEISPERKDLPSVVETSKF